MQLLLKELIKDLISSSLGLDSNIHIQISNIAEKRLFDCAVGAIKYYWPVKPLTHAKSIFFWLAKLSSLVEPLIDPKRTKSKSHYENSNINNGININNKMDEEISCVDELSSTHIGLSTNPNRTKSEV